MFGHLGFLPLLDWQMSTCEGLIATLFVGGGR